MTPSEKKFCYDNILRTSQLYGNDSVGYTAINKLVKDINVPCKYEIDCNECEHLNMTEQEQTNKRDPHICLFYNVRVLHNIDRQPHNSKLYTCSECARDNYVQFKLKKATERR